MDVIKINVEQLVNAMGLTGSYFQIVEHIILVAITAILAWGSEYVCRKLLTPTILRLTNRVGFKWSDIIFNMDMLKAACRIIPAIVVWKLLPVAFNSFDTVMIILERLTAIYITIMSARLGIVFVNSFKLVEHNVSPYIQQYIKSSLGVFKIIVIFIATIITVAILIDKNPSTLFAGLGATSAVLMLVFKDTITGLVAGIRLTSNNMIKKGDWITVPSAGADGNVIDITLSTVKVQNFDNTIVTVSPQSLMNDSFKNWKGMQEGGGRKVEINVFYDFNSIRIADDDLKKKIAEKGYMSMDDMKGDVVNLTLFRHYCENYLRKSELVNTDMDLMVRQRDIVPGCGLKVQFYFFLKCKTWAVWENQWAEIMEYFYAISSDFGLNIYQQFPKQGKKTEI